MFIFCFDTEESTVASLEAKVRELEAKQDDLLSASKAKEEEFGRKRAQFKDIFLQKESKIFYPSIYWGISF